jgi:hypothetical protein
VHYAICQPICWLLSNCTSFTVSQGRTWQKRHREHLQNIPDDNRRRMVNQIIIVQVHTELRAVSHYVRRRRATVATISNLRSISSHTAANTIVTTIPPQPSTNITLQSSPWNSATVVTVVIGAGALFVAILTLVLKYHGKVKVS